MAINLELLSRVDKWKLTPACSWAVLLNLAWPLLHAERRPLRDIYETQSSRYFMYVRSCCTWLLALPTRLKGHLTKTTNSFPNCMLHSVHFSAVHSRGAVLCALSVWNCKNTEGYHRNLTATFTRNWIHFTCILFYRCPEKRELIFMGFTPHCIYT